MSRILLTASCVLASLHASLSVWAVDWPSSPSTIVESYPGSITSLPITLPSVNPSGDNLSSWEVVTQPIENAGGTLTGGVSPGVGKSITYNPALYEDKNVSFTWRAINDSNFSSEIYTYRINTTPVDNPPEIQSVPGLPPTMNFPENQNIVGNIVVFDPDTLPPNDLLLEVNGTDGLAFDANYSSSIGNFHTYQVWYTPSPTPNYEALTKSYSVQFKASNRDSLGNTISQSPVYTVAINLTNQEEPPVVISENTMVRTINEGENTDGLFGFSPMQISARDPEAEVDSNKKITWSYTTNNPVLGGAVILWNNGTSFVLAAGATSSFYNSGDLVTVQYVPTADAFGTGLAGESSPEVLTFIATDDAGRTSSAINITMKVVPINDDPITLNEASPINVTFVEEGTGVAYDFNTTDPDSDPDPLNRVDNNSSITAGRQIFYTLSGADKDFFQISATGGLSFRSPPDFETPQDLGGAVGDRIYELTVGVQDSANAPFNSDSQPITVEVTPMNELPTLAGGTYAYDIQVIEDLTWTWNSGMRDINSTLIDLNATDVDAGEQINLSWRMKSGSGGAYGTALVSGTGGIPSSLTYVPDLDYAGDGNVSNPDDTFIVEIFDGVGVTEIMFRVFIVALDDPPRIQNITPTPLEPLSVYRERYTIYLNENNPSTVRLQFNEVDGGGTSAFQILPTSPDFAKFEHTAWTAGATYADINFTTAHLPDFEANQSSDGDGNYSIIFRVYDDQTPPPNLGKYQDLYLDFIVQDVDEAPTFAPAVDFNQTVLENQRHAATLTALDPEGASSFYWTIIYGSDSPKFDLNASSGSSVDLRFIVPPNYEAPLDEPTYGDKNNTYVVRVMVSDAPSGGKSTTQTFVLFVTDDNDFPTISPIPLNIDEPFRTNPMLDLSQYGLDEDNQSGAGSDVLSWGKISGDTIAFALEQNGTLRFNQDSDYETKTSFSIEVRVTDGRGGYADANFSVEVNAQNEPPEFFENNASTVKIGFLETNLDEDTSTSGDLRNHVSDPETGLVGLVYGHNFIDFNSSNDSNGSVLLNVLTGAYTFTPRPNYSGLTYVDFTVSDGLLTGVLPVVFSVASIPDPPVVRESNNTTEITNLLPKAIIEGNSTFGIEFNATDPYDTPSSTNFIWNLQGPDATKFKVEPNVGSYVTLSLLQVPNFEIPHDSGSDNRFDLNVSVTDDSGSVLTFPVQLTVLDGPEPPYFDYGDNNKSVTHKVATDFPENATGTVFDAHAFDLDGSAIVYGLTDPNPMHGGQGPDNHLFYVNPSSGKVTFISPPDFETPQDLNATNIYVLELNATDDPANSNKISHFVTITVTNVIEPPVFTAGASRAIDWNETTTSMIEANQTKAEDANETVELELSGGADKLLFFINVSTGMLSFINPADYENPGSADGDNVYDVQIRIKGTNTTQNLTITVKEENDNPVINNSNLTQLTVNENQMFVIDLDVTDQDFGSKYLDILYTKESNSSRFVAHTGTESSVGAFYPQVSSGMVDNQLPSASFSVAGDLDQDGDVDVVCLERNQSIYFLHYLQNNGSGTFSRAGPFVLDGGGKALDHVVISDLDQDGDKDIILSYFGDGGLGGARISWLRNNGGGAFDNEVEIISRAAGVGVDIDYFAIGDLDGDSYPDLVVAWRGVNSVVWFKNNKALNPKFTYKGYVMSPAQGLDAPRSIELVDIDNSGSLDVIISANQNLYLAVNDGSETVFTISTLTSFTGAGIVAKAVDVTQDGLMDVVYATSMGVPGVIVQSTTGFDAPISLPTHADPLKAVAYPTDIAILPATPNTTRIGILVSDSSINYLSLFEASPSLNGQFDQPVHINTGLGVVNIALADLNLRSDYLSYSFVGGEDQDDFNATRFRDEGKLYFKFSPDFENPKDAGQISRYDVLIKVTDNQGGETIQPVAVSVNEVNDPPVITDFNRSYMASHDHSESRLYTLFEVNATNDENTTQTLTYSLAGGADESNFTIDSTTGKLTFLQPPDFESPSDSNKDNAYNVIVRVTDNGQPSAYDEQNITINIVDGFEPPKFDTTFSRFYTIDEDNSLPAFFLTAVDQNPSFGGVISSFGIDTNGTDGNATVTNNAVSPVTANFSYVPDGNFTGTDTVVVNVTNDSGLTVTLPITITVNSFNDPPEILTPLDWNHSENKQEVTDLSGQPLLSAKDDSGQPLLWTWAGLDPVSQYNPNDDFLLTSAGNLSFRLLKGPDYESPDHNKSYVLPLRVTDSDGNYTDGSLTINVVNVNDNPPLSPHLRINASSTFTLVENNTTIVDLNASDADYLAPITYSITGGPDSTRFSVTSLGKLSLFPAPDFESPSSADLDNIYQAELTLSDGGYTQIHPIIVTVTDADENKPKITSDGGGATANISVYENKKVATQVQATDVESDVFTYSIWGGTDMNAFEINSTTGELSFVTLPNFEAITDHNQDWRYEVYVRVSDGYSTADQNITITVTDEDEIPTVSPAILYTTEDVPIEGITFTISDPEGKPYAEAYVHTFPEHGSTNWSVFPLGSPSDVKFDYVPAANFHGTDYLVLTVTDNVKQGQVTIPIEINSTADPPTANPDEYIYDDPTGVSILIDVLANDSSAPDSNTSDSLIFPEGAWTKPKYGLVGPSPAGSTTPYSYSPPANFIGVDTFEYTVYDTDDKLESTGTVNVIVKRATDLPSWRFLKNVGYYNLSANNWIYHTNLGWLYLQNINDLVTATWVWHLDLGWFWTGDKYAPNVYLNDLDGWFAFTVEEAVGEAPKKYMTWPIYDQTKKAWMTTDELKVARVNTVLSKLTALEDIISFVQDSNLFTAEEKVVIKTELTFTGTSSTMLAKGFTLRN
jgi:hypothetical protein